MERPINALAASGPGEPLEPFSYDPGPLKPDEVEIDVTHCGLCHSDVSMLDNDWQMTAYPFVPGHEAVGRVVAAGPAVPGLVNSPGDPVGRMVGLGWTARTCGACTECLSGHQNLCGSGEGTIVGRHGGFATRVRAHWSWVLPLPEKMNPATAGPLFCGGITVFHPLLRYGVRPVDRVGVVGIGGLGSMAIQFLNKWGCEVTAFSSNPAKTDDLLKMGAHHVVNSRDSAVMTTLHGRFQYVVSTVNVTLDWSKIVNTLAPGGHLHLVGATLEPIPVSAFSLLAAERTIGGSPTGTPETLMQMLEFAARHGIEPITETFRMSDANAAIEHLKSGKARYRVVLENDLGR